MRQAFSYPESQSFRRNKIRARMMTIIGFGIGFCGLIILMKHFYSPQALLFSASSLASDNDQSEYSPVGETIHIMTVIHDQDQVIQAVTMIKSILYYQGRLADVSDGMCYAWHPNQPDGVYCRMVELFTLNPLMLHWIVPNRIKSELVANFARWELDSVNLVTYDMEDLTISTRGVRMDESEYPPPYFKLMANEILPKEVEKVIVLDPGLLFSGNIMDLWEEMNSFSQDQVIGGVYTQSEKCSQPIPVITLGEQPKQTIELDLGVLLLNLGELRKMDWPTIWEWEKASQLNSGIPWQDVTESVILNSILTRNPQLSYKLPCEWNVQLGRNLGDGCCKTYWIDQDPVYDQCTYESDTLSRLAPMARVIQMDVRDKLDGNSTQSERSFEFDVPAIAETADQMREKFYQMYYTFRRLPRACFT